MLQYLKRILRDGNHLDKDLINDQFLPIAEGSYELDGQNFAGNAVTSGFVGNEALSLTQYAEHTISTGIIVNASVVGFHRRHWQARLRFRTQEIGSLCRRISTLRRVTRWWLSSRMCNTFDRRLALAPHIIRRMTERRQRVLSSV